MSDARVRYARNGDIRLAYRVFGESETTIVWVPGWVVGNVDSLDEPGSPYARAIETLPDEVKLVAWDRRGTGLSDPSSHVLSLEDRLQDLLAVINAVGDDRVSLFGTSEGGPVSILFATRYPDRVRSLVLYGTAARFSQDTPDFPWGWTDAAVESQLAEIDDHWGEGALAELFYGDAAAVPGVRELFGKLQRSVSSPSMAKLWWRTLMDTDVREVLCAIAVPTMVLARPGDQLVPVEASAALAAGIPNAQFRLLAPGPHTPFDIIDDVMRENLAFVVDRASAPADERVLKAVMFTDIVSSTEELSAIGDRAWRQQLDSHDSVVDIMLSRYGGNQAKHTGDGVIALFDAPTRAARCALELVAALAARGIHIRAGIHTGECERRGDEWSGMAVHIGARIGALAGSGEVLASRSVRDLSAGSGLTFESRGPRQLKDLPEHIDIYRVALT